MLSQKIKEYIEQRLAAKLEPIDKALAKLNVSSEKRDELTLDREAVCRNHESSVWLTDAAICAKQISLVTHVAKFTHSASKSMGALVTEQLDTSLLVTASLPCRELDFACNAGVLHVAKLFKLKDDNGQLLADQLRSGEGKSLASFSKSPQQLEEWLEGFSRAFESSEPQSHTLAKQLYFPVDGSYHQISPLYASSLAHAIRQKVFDSRNGELMDAARKARENDEPSDTPTISYPSLAVIKFGGDTIQGKGNISHLNQLRSGEGYLLSCQPPSWKAHSQVPKTSHQFWQQLAYICRYNLRALKKHLTNYQDKPSTESVRSKRQQLVEDIVDDFLQLSAQIRLLSEQVGIDNDWSAASELTSAEACLLNPQRTQQDADFKSVRERKDWLEDIGREFGQWLNNHLQTDKLNFGDLERDHWARLIKNTLVQLRDDLSFLQGAS